MLLLFSMIIEIVIIIIITIAFCSLIRSKQEKFRGLVWLVFIIINLNRIGVWNELSSFAVVEWKRRRNCQIWFRFPSLFLRQRFDQCFRYLETEKQKKRSNSYADTHKQSAFDHSIDRLSILSYLQVNGNINQMVTFFLDLTI